MPDRTSSCGAKHARRHHPHGLTLVFAAAARARPNFWIARPLANGPRRGRHRRPSTERRLQLFSLRV
ncbi:hypothetical protein C6P97_31465 [Burkholderia multivorans]|uniref:Uncharacterized protein n=1 Tax=Burkholderia multivorans TaxID=87883 RepID=A0AB37AW55_9BURK|nr:hypothetical protein C6P97_31465 [Burkholderia multivorans]PRE53070.1 hypothetical protein C6P99_06365 [Burkholderia multivorans]